MQQQGETSMQGQQQQGEQGQIPIQKGQQQGSSQQQQQQGGQLQERQGRQGQLQTLGGDTGGVLSTLVDDPFSLVDDLMFGNSLFPTRFNIFPRHRHGRRGRQGLGSLIDLPSSAFALTSVPQLSSELKENENSYALNVDVPGMHKQDINVSVDGNTINISGRRQEEKENDENVSGTVWHTREISRGQFNRTFELPDANVDELDAKVENGVLHIVVPKIKKASQKKQIEIK